jgi:hypothetical protein
MSLLLLSLGIALLLFLRDPVAFALLGPCLVYVLATGQSSGLSTRLATTGQRISAATAASSPERPTALARLLASAALLRFRPDPATRSRNQCSSCGFDTTAYSNWFAALVASGVFDWPPTYSESIPAGSVTNCSLNKKSVDNA